MDEIGAAFRTGVADGSAWLGVAVAGTVAGAVAFAGAAAGAAAGASAAAGAGATADWLVGFVFGSVMSGFFDEQAVKLVTRTRSSALHRVVER